MSEQDDEAAELTYENFGAAFSGAIVMSTDSAIALGLDPNHAAGVLISTAMTVAYQNGATPEEIADWLGKYAERAPALCRRLAQSEAEGETKQ